MKEFFSYFFGAGETEEKETAVDGEAPQECE